jgi:hypothetical protein
MSLELRESTAVQPIPTKFSIHLHSIFTQKDGNWKIKLNEYYLKKGDRLPWNNIEILEVKEDYIILKINTPKGIIERKIGCNEEYVINYL